MGRFGCIFRISRRERQGHVLVMKTIGQIDGNPKADFTEREERRRIMVLLSTETAEKRTDPAE